MSATQAGRRYGPWLAATGIALLIAGCGPAIRYQSPGLTPATAASVSGSRNTYGGIFTRGDTYLVGVDGKPVPIPPIGGVLNTNPVLIRPGLHALDVRFDFGAYSAFPVVIAKLERGGVYTLRGERLSACGADVWIEDAATKKPLTPKEAAAFGGDVNTEVDATKTGRVTRAASNLALAIMCKQ